MTTRAAITVYRPREEVERLWNDPDHKSSYLAEQDVRVSFIDAPGDRGTEIHIDIAQAGIVGAAQKLIGGTPALAKAKDALRRFKQHVETGELATAGP